MGRRVTESKSLFRKHLMLFFITILIPTVLLLAWQVQKAMKDADAQIESVSQSHFDRASRNLDMLLDQLNQLSLQIALMPGILDLLTRPFDLPVYQYAEVKDQMQSWMTSNPLYYSIYLEILQNHRILTTGEGIYEEENFYDRIFMYKLQSSQQYGTIPWTGMRIVEGGQQQQQLLTFARAIPPTQSTALGLLVLNMRRDVFLHTLTNLQSEAAGPLIVLDPQGQLISEPIAGLDTHKLAESLGSKAELSLILQLSDHRYLLTGKKIPSNGWTLLQLTPYATYNEQLAVVIRQAVIVLVVVLLLGIIVSYFFASILYVPWRRLAERLQNNGLRNTPGNRDAYTFVNSAFYDLMTVIRQNEPIVRDHLIHDLLHDHLPEGTDPETSLREAGIRFVYPYCAVLVLSDESADALERNEYRGLYLYSLAEEMLRSRLPSAGTILERDRYAFILNLEYGVFDEHQMAAVENCCRDIRRAAEERFRAYVSFFVSDICPLALIHEAYEQLKRTMVYKAFMPNNVHFIDSEQQTMELQYPASYQKQIASAILRGNKQLADDYISELFELYLNNSGYPYPKLMQMIIMLMSHVLSSLVQEGYDIGPLMDEIDLLQLQKCQNRVELQSLIAAQISRVIAYLDTVRTRASDYSVPVRQAIDFMENRFSGNISISDIAAAIGISPSHLSRIFKAEVGKTPLEYLTEHRLNVSKQLLRDKSRPLQSISEMVGFYEVRTFIRSFKKAEGTTPGEYRKRMET